MSERVSALYPAHIEEMKRRYDRALAAAGFDQAVVYAGAQHVAFLDDYTYPFKVNPQFKAWLPVLDNPHCAVIYAPGARPILAYYQPVDYWHKPAGDPSGFWVEQFDVRVIDEPAKLQQLIPAGKRTAYIGEDDASFQSWGFAASNPQPLIDRLHFDRAWKTDYEIECMREANRSGARAHRAAEKAFRSGASEYEIHLAYLREASHLEEQLPYGNIVAINENAAVLHYQQHLQERSSGERRSFLIDAGTQFNGYASDITRTYSQQQDDFQKLIDAMDAMQLELCEAVKPGVDYKEIHFQAHRGVGRILEEFGLVDIDGDAAFEKRITSAFFPHGVGHFIGLQVHDVGGFFADASGKMIDKPKGHPHLRLTRVVEPRQSFTIEPGLYFIDSLLADLKKSENSKHVRWDRVNAFRPFGGIRIEDDVVVTESGHENLTRPAFNQ
jgi:Xaa-Pro dipeptidase